MIQARCGRYEEHGAHWMYDGDDGWCAGNKNVIVAREAVECDENCGAPDEPETDEEYRRAYEHWRRHGYLAGCSHAR